MISKLIRNIIKFFSNESTLSQIILTFNIIWRVFPFQRCQEPFNFLPWNFYYIRINEIVQLYWALKMSKHFLAMYSSSMNPSVHVSVNQSKNIKKFKVRSEMIYDVGWYFFSLLLMSTIFPFKICFDDFLIPLLAGPIHAQVWWKMSKKFIVCSKTMLWCWLIPF